MNTRTGLLFVFICLLIGLAIGMALAANSVGATSTTPMGFMVVSPYSGDWNTRTRPLIRQAQASIVKVQIAEGFRFEPQHVRDLIADGVRTIALTTEDCDASYDNVWTELVGRGFWPVVRDNPQVMFYLELGNEIEICGLDHWLYKRQAADTLNRLRPQVNVPNLRFVTGAFTELSHAQDVLGDGQLRSLGLYGYGAHVYGHYNLGDEPKWNNIYNYVRSLGPVLVTEIGINDQGISKTTKAQRYVEWVNATPSNVLGVTVFAIGVNTSWPQYEVTSDMAQIIGQRNGLIAQPQQAPSPCTFYPETGKSVCHGFRDYFNQYGGVRIFGYPISNEFIEDGMTVQYFERNVFEYHPNNPADWRVLLRRLGADEYQRRY
jgi:hypothetical protein